MKKLGRNIWPSYSLTGKILLLLWNVIGKNVEDIHSYPTNLDDILFVLLSQDNSYHAELAWTDKQNFFNQVPSFQNKPNFLLLHEEWPEMIGGWTILPLLSRLMNDERVFSKKWLFMCEEHTGIDLESALHFLEYYNPHEEHFLGHALWDLEPSIIHHFAFAENPSSFHYPDSSSGFLLSMPLAKKLSERHEENIQTHDFSIDAKYELAQFIWDEGRGKTLVNVDTMCLKKRKGCATWVQETPSCDAFEVDVENVYFAVKTYSKFHSERVPVIKRTWSKDCSKLTFYSDVDDSTIPTVNIGIPNTGHGHCAKTLAILRHIVSLDSAKTLKWVVVADDDTLISVKRLVRLLSCYNASEDVAIGERYGYNVVSGEGYDYITGGGGMVFTMSTVRRLVSSRDCYCPLASSPDDMTLGICLKHLGIPVTHSPLFHQARPLDYNPDYLNYWKHISFHKHWMINPVTVYNEWLKEDDSHDHDHTEL